MIKTLKQLKRILITVVGGTILAIGIVLIVLPGPSFIVIPIGLSILATEYIWAKKMVEKFKVGFERVKNWRNNSNSV